MGKSAKVSYDLLIKKTGNLSDLNTTDKANLVGAINEVKEAMGNAGYGDMMKATYDSNSDGKVNAADKADKLSTGHTISVSGDATGSSSAFDGTTNATIPVTLSSTGVTAGDYTKVTVDTKGRVTSGGQATATDVGAIPASQKGSAGGVAELDAEGKVPASQLPSFVDDVLEYPTKANFPATGESGKIYIDISTNMTWRWGGTVYVEVSSGGIALGETSSTAYRGDHGKTAYDHSQATGNPHNLNASHIGVATGATKTESSTTNGNLKINGSEVPIFSEDEIKESLYVSLSAAQKTAKDYIVIPD